MRLALVLHYEMNTQQTHPKTERRRVPKHLFLPVVMMAIFSLLLNYRFSTYLIDSSTEPKENQIAIGILRDENQDKELILTNVPEWYHQPENIQYFVINLPRSTERLQSLESLLQREKVEYRIEEAVDAHADQHQENLNTCPCLPQDSHHGTKALTMSNLNIFKKVLDLENPPEWIGIFEDDAILPLNFNLLISHSILKFPKAKVINFDKRTRRNPECCTALVLYHRSLLELLVKELDFKKSVNMAKYERPCLLDWYLFDMLRSEGVNITGIPVVGSGSFESTLNIG